MKFDFQGKVNQQYYNKEKKVNKYSTGSNFIY